MMNNTGELYSLADRAAVAVIKAEEWLRGHDLPEFYAGCLGWARSANGQFAIHATWGQAWKRWGELSVVGKLLAVRDLEELLAVADQAVAEGRIARLTKLVEKAERSVSDL